MRVARIAGAFMFAIPLWSGAVPTLDLSRYQLEDGAITLKRNESFVDPYFPTKALLIASQQGMNISKVTQKWVNWLLTRQLADGRFMRYCKPAPQSEWIACKEADADDAMMAMWVALLAQTTRGKMPPQLLDSIERSLAQLEKLRVPATGVYNISASNQVALLMDNVEIYEGYDALFKYFKSHGESLKAKKYATRAMSVAAAIEKIFWMPSLKQYRVTTQARQADDFYPDRVAQIYPLLGGLPDIRHDSRSAYTAWLRANKKEWQTMKSDYFPWGLVAIVAERMGDRNSVACWFANAGMLREGTRWNVLEEIVYATLQRNYADVIAEDPSC